MLANEICDLKSVNDDDRFVITKFYAGQDHTIDEWDALLSKDFSSYNGIKPEKAEDTEKAEDAKPKKKAAIKQQ